MKKVLLILGALVLTGCNDYDTKWYISSKNSIMGSDKAAEFIVKCAQAANPLSDEEGEDLVQQCESTAKSIYATKVWYAYQGKSAWYHKCESADLKETKACLREIKGE